MGFADNLIYLRQRYGVTQEGLAEQLGVSRQTVSKWESGTNYPEMEKLLALCDLFHANLDDLVRGSVSVADENDTERYDRHMNRFDLSLVAGVAIILVGVGVQVGLGALGVVGDNLTAAVFLSFVVVGVVVLTVGALNHGEFRRRNPSIEPRYSAEALERFGRRFPFMIAGGVGVILLAVIFLVGVSPEGETTIYIGGAELEEIIIMPFMFAIALGTGLIMWGCLQKSKYDLSELTYVGQRHELGADLPPTVSVKTPEQVRAERMMGVACGVIMLLATIVFLVWGFMPLFDSIGGWDGMDRNMLKDAVKSGQGGFAVSWIAFVVGGILCGIVCLIGSVAFKSKEDWVAEAKQEDAWLKVVESKDRSDRPSADSSQSPKSDGRADAMPRNAEEKRSGGSSWK